MTRPLSNVRWPTVVAIPVLLLATYMDWHWVWGCLFLYWALPGLKSGEAYLVEPIQRLRNPILFWMITVMWAGFGIWFIVADLYWRLT